jgi:hypothetical protein
LTLDARVVLSAALLAVAAPAAAQDAPAPEPAAAAAPAPEESTPGQAPAATSAAPATASIPAPEAAPAPTAAATATSAVELGKPAAGKGQIVFFRNSFQGMLIRCTVRENGTLVSGLPNGRYFVRDVEPGLHTLTAATESKDTLRLEVEAGEVYYNRCTISMGLMVGRPNLSPSDKATFEKDQAKLKLQDPPAAGEN